MPTRDLNIIFEQFLPKWGDVDANKLALLSKVNTAETCDLIVFPEMALSGFSFEPNFAIKSNDPFFEDVQMSAQRHDCAVVFSALTEENQRFYNRMYFISSSGIEVYDKKHLFSYAKEDKFLTQGNERKLVNYKGWSIALFICYDLRFPVWCRNANTAYDLAIFVANWPYGRHGAFHALLRARAIENQSYVLGVNTVGVDGNDIEYVGCSFLAGPDGGIKAVAGNSTSPIRGLASASELEDFRREFPFLNDADDFVIT